KMRATKRVKSAGPAERLTAATKSRSCSPYKRVVLSRRRGGRPAHAPDGVAHVVGHQQRAARRHRDADRPPAGFATLVQEAIEDADGLAGRPPLGERNEDHLVP